MAAPAKRSRASSIGALLQYWRKVRNLSQLALAQEADVSPRHICFVETGRARPSREAVAETLLQRVHREAVGGVKDARTQALLQQLLSYPGVPSHLHRPDLATPLVPIVPVCFRKDDMAYAFFSTVTTLGTPQDVTLQEIRIECFFPADEATRRRMHASAPD